MKRLLTLLLIALVLLAGAALLLVDDLLESAIEREGSRALQARLEIGSAHLRLFPTALTLRDIAATNPRAPQRNLATAESLYAEFTLGQLLERRLVVERAVLSGVRFDQPRQHSGAIPGVTPATTASTATALPALTAPDADRLAGEAAATLRTELQSIEQALREINARWQARLQQPAADDDAQLRADWHRVSLLVGRARALPDAELQRLLAEANPGGGSIGQPTQLLLAHALAPMVAQVSALAGGERTGNGGDWLMLVRRVDVDGELAIGASRLPFSGQLGNVTPQPSRWNLPLTVELSGAGQLLVTGSFDYSRAVDGRLQLTLERFPVAGLPLIDHPDLQASLQRADLSARGLLVVRGGDIELELGSQFRDATLTASAGAPAAAQLARLLNGTDRIDLQLRLRGRADAPQLTVRSSLDQPLAAALADAARLQAADFAPRLRAALQQQLAPQLDTIRQQTDTFNAVQAQLQQRRDSAQ
jgi:hypothetical protein